MDKEDTQEISSVPFEKLPTIMNAVQIMEMKLPEPKWAVPNTIAEGLSILAGNPKLGKSWLALGLSWSVASGRSALGTIPVEAGDVLYLALEDTKQRLKDRLQAISNGQPTPHNLEFATHWPQLDDGGLDELAKWLEGHVKARLVIIDTLTKVRPARKAFKGIYGEDYEHMSSLKNLADAHGVAILVIHHTNKAGANDDPIEAVSGSFGLSGAADSVLILKRERGQHDATLLVTGRDVEEQEIALKWEQDTCNWLTMGDAAGFRLDADHKKLIDILEASEHSLSPKEIAPLLGKSYDATRKMLSRMANKGLIKSVGFGKYTSLGHTCHSGHTSEKDKSSDSIATHKDENNTVVNAAVSTNYHDTIDDAMKSQSEQPQIVSDFDRLEESQESEELIKTFEVGSKNSSMFSFADAA